MKYDNRAWLFLVPALAVMALSAFIPLMTVVNYSLHYIFSGSIPEFVGFANFVDVMRDSAFRGALGRQLLFSVSILAVEIPLGIAIALSMPKKGIGVAISLVLLGIPLLIPYNVVGIVWRLFSQSDIGLIAEVLSWVGYEYNVSLDPVDAPVTLFLLDVWHWTPLVALLSYAGYLAIPDAFYRAAEIDGASRWKVFRFVILPKLRPVLVLAFLLRFMDSFKIYAEPLLLTGGGPGNTTTFMSLFVARKAQSYELGYAGAASLIYLFIVIVMSYIFFQLLNKLGSGESQKA
ncbi:MAG TPA: sugar ABC transporter permease [Halalkalibaculum sp.]|nr:sugar ABC transporter permease [Clostridia bacterium]HKL19962.1 sugar ABC transporter permease [Halalkalibaculum sp.]